MTIYALDPTKHELVAVWAQGVAHRALTIARLPDDVVTELANELADELTMLSRALWDTYVAPAGAADDEQERNQRDFEREGFGEVLEALRSPNLPSDTGLLLVSYSPVRERAHRVGRVLNKIALADLTDLIASDVKAELAAVERAELGDLSERATQATALDRVDASPVQVAAAHALFEANPLGHPELFNAVDPAAACVAAAHWLTSAAVVAGDLGELEPSQVFEEADNVVACSVEVPQLIVRAVEQVGQKPAEMVLHLLWEATEVRQGRIPDLPALLTKVAKAADRVEDLPQADRSDAYEALLPERITLLDPQRPARDLLEHLLDGLRSCLMVFEEFVGYDDRTDAPTIDGALLPHPHGDEWRERDPDEEDPDHNDAVHEAIEIAFVERVREQSDLYRDRLD